MSPGPAGMPPGFGGMSSGGGGGAGRGATRVLESRGTTTWTVALEDRARFEPGPAYRTVRVHAVDGPEDLARAVQSSARLIEAIGLEARGPERVRLAAVFTALGVPRVAPIGQLQRPSPLGTHGGVRRLGPFVTWSSVEGSAAKQATPSAAAAPRAAKAPRKAKSKSKSSAWRSSGRRSPRKAPKRRR